MVHFKSPSFFFFSCFLRALSCYLDVSLPPKRKSDLSAYPKSLFPNLSGLSMRDDPVFQGAPCFLEPSSFALRLCLRQLVSRHFEPLQIVIAPLSPPRDYSRHFSAQSNPPLPDRLYLVPFFFRFTAAGAHAFPPLPASEVASPFRRSPLL